MDSWFELFQKSIPQILEWAVSLGLGAGGGIGAARLAMRRQRRISTNLRRPLMLIGTAEDDLVAQARLLREVGLFDVPDVHRGEKALDYLKPEHRLLVVGYSPTPVYRRIFERARHRQLPMLVYAKPGAVVQEDIAQISDYSYASVCNTDLRLVSDVFALMSTFPEKP